MKTATAWQSIGWDDGLFKIKGGRQLYEAVFFNCDTSGEKVILSRLKVVEKDGEFAGIKEVSRYVDPDTVLEFEEEL